MPRPRSQSGLKVADCLAGAQGAVIEAAKFDGGAWVTVSRPLGVRRLGLKRPQPNWPLVAAVAEHAVDHEGDNLLDRRRR
jgi:hypothetical protein